MVRVDEDKNTLVYFEGDESENTQEEEKISEEESNHLTLKTKSSV